MVININLCVGALVYGITLTCDHDLRMAQEMVLRKRFWYPNPDGLREIPYRVRVS